MRTPVLDRRTSPRLKYIAKVSSSLKNSGPTTTPTGSESLLYEQENFHHEHELSNVVNEKTCFKNMQNPSCIDLLLTNNSCAFQQTTTVCSGLSHCHKLVFNTVLTVLKTSIPKGNPRQSMKETTKSSIL